MVVTYSMSVGPNPGASSGRYVDHEKRSTSWTRAASVQRPAVTPATPSARSTSGPRGRTNAARASDPIVTASESSVTTVAAGAPQRTSAPGSVNAAKAVNAPENAPAATRAASATSAAAGSATAVQGGAAGPAAPARAGVPVLFRASVGVTAPA